MPNEDTNPPINDPYTDLRWTNFSRSPQTNGLNPYIMTNGPTPLGELVTINADITLNGTFEHSF